MFKPIGISITFILFILNSEAALNYKTSYPTFPTVELSDDSDEKIAQYVPNIITPNTTIKVKQGDNVTMSCQVDIDRGNMGLLWLKGLVSLYYDKKVIIPYNRSSVETSSRGSNLTIVSVKESDAGEYSCQVVTNHAKIKTFYNLIVAVPPEVAAYPTTGHLKVNESQSINLACEAKGVPKPTIVWKKNGDGDIPRAEINYSKLRIPSASKEDTGVYTCTVDNIYQLPVVKSFQVLVYFQPMIRIKDKVIYSKIGERVKLVCNSDGYPKPDEEWRREIFGPRLENYVNNDESYSVVDIKSKNDFGGYICKASNSIGEAMTRVEVTGRPMPPIILNPEDDYVTPQQPFELKYKVISKSPLTKVIFALRHSNISGHFAPWNMSEVEVTTKPSYDQVYEMNYEFGKLNANCNYEVKVYAENEYGRSFSSNIHTLLISRKSHLGNSASPIILSVPIMLITIFISMMKRIL